MRATFRAGGLIAAMSLGAVSIGLAVLVAHALGAQWLVEGGDGGQPMRPLTAFTFIVAGTALYMTSMPRRSWLRRYLGTALAASVTALGAGMLVSLLRGVHLPDPADLARPSDLLRAWASMRMGGSSAATFFTLGVALLLVDWQTPRGHRPSQYLALVALLAPLHAVFSHAYDMQAFFSYVYDVPDVLSGATGSSSYSFVVQMAIHTAASFIMLSVGVLFVRPQSGFMALIVGDSFAGYTARRFLVPCLVIPPALGWFIVAGFDNGFFDPRFGASLLTLASVVLFGMLIWSSASGLHRLEADRLRAETRLTRFKFMSDHAAEPHLLMNARGDLVYVNLNACERLGYTESELLRMRFVELDTVYVGERFDELFEAAQRRWVPPFESVHVTKTGARIKVECAATGVAFDGEPFLLIVARDITDRKAAEAKIREADKRKDEFLAMLAHELRNPLAPIRNGLHILRAPNASGQQQERARFMMDRQITHLTRLVDDLLDVSRISRGKIILRKETVDLRGVVANAVEDMRGIFDEVEQRVTTELTEEPVYVQGDATRLAQIVQNLLTNANKFTDRGGSVEVRLRCEDGEAVLEVRDDGCGLHPALAGRLFEPFAQADSSLERSRGGLGLGLALVRGLVEMHRGSVEATSEGEGLGSTFRVRLPIDDVGSAPLWRPRGRGMQQHRRILVVEDNLDAAESLRLVLELAGHEVAVAHTGQEGLRAAGETKPEIILCDIGLPAGMNGYAFARAIRGDRELAGTFLIALTGYGQQDDVQRAHDAGFDVHLVKPVDPEALDRLLQNAGRRDRATDGQAAYSISASTKISKSPS